MQDEEPEVRKRAADVARRISEKELAFLEPIAEDIGGILAELPIGENRTRWHLGLVVARVARTPVQISFTAELMWRLAEDESNVVRCSAIEGLGLLALRDRTLRQSVDELLRQALQTGTLAMKCRAREAIRRLDRNRN